MTIPPEDIAQIKQLREAATPGLLHFDDEGSFLFVNWPTDPQMVLEVRGFGARLPQEANGRYAEAAWNNIPRLLAEREADKAWIERAKPLLEELRVWRKEPRAADGCCQTFEDEAAAALVNVSDIDAILAEKSDG